MENKGIEKAEETEEKVRLLLVEDDEDLLLITAMKLQRRGYKVISAQNGAEAMAVIRTQRIDLLLLDVMLPDCDGQELCRELRGEPCCYDGPVIFVSCMGDSTSIVDAFRGGGNDYLVKPVDIDMLVERIQVNLKERVSRSAEQGKQWFRQFVIDRRLQEVHRVVDGQLGEKLDLSPTEYKLLAVITTMPDEVALYRQLYQKVWGQEALDDYRTLMVHMSNLRKKIDGAHTEVIRAVRGTGYIFHDV